MRGTKEQQRIYQQLYRQARRAKAKASLGDVCVKCGSDENIEFDHIDPSTKLGSIASMIDSKKEVFWTEVRKCQLLCRDCHVIKTRNEGHPPPPIKLGEDNSRSKLTEADVREIRRKVQSGSTWRELGKQYNVSHSTIGNIIQGKTWTHM